MNSLAKNWENNQAISPKEFIELAKKVGLMEVKDSNHKHHNASSLEDKLKAHGPLWCAGFWYGPGHIIVLTGVDADIVFLNDPDKGKPKMGSIPWFNDKLASNFPGCIMAKDPKQY